MNELPFEKRRRIVNMLLEGNSVRGIARMIPCSVNTVSKLLEDIGTACMLFHDEKVRNVSAKLIQCDEIWSFVYAKEKNAAKTRVKNAGDAWTFIAIDPKTKLVISWKVGKRDSDTALEFMLDVKDRAANRVQLTTDGFKPYLEAIDMAFEGNIDYAQLVKMYGKPVRNGKKDNRQQYIGAEKVKINGKPVEKYISTSIVERQNLTMRTHIRRFARKTNAYSKKMENHCYAQAIHFVYYNFVKIHTSIRVTPAMEAGLMSRWMEIDDIVNMANRKANYYE